MSLVNFKRVWDESCPRVWDSWDGKDGVKWVIRDLLPSDDEEAIKILKEDWCPDEPIYKHNDLVNDPIAMELTLDFWRKSLASRMSLGCYKEKDGSSKLVALNVCSVSFPGEDLNEEYKNSPHFGKNKARENALGALSLCEEKQDPFEYLGVDKILKGYALVVRRDYRGLGLGLKLLAARQPLSLLVGVKGSATVFTSPASQVLAERAGFTTISTVTWKDFADAGLDYPADETQYYRTMYFKRIWDESCPRMWDSWDGANGVKWVIRDLRPADDEEAIKILVEHWCPDESMYKHKGLVNDPVTIEFTKCLWRECLGTRTSLGCYMEKDGCSKLVALNVCCVQCQGEDLYEHHKNSSWKEIESKAGENVKNALVLCEKKHDVFKYLGVDKALKAFGLVVHRDYRGLGLGLKLLAARKSLALHLGVKGTATVFTGRASQILAERAGFTTLSTVTWKELHEAGLDYPATEKLCLKFMVKKYA